MRTSLLLLLLLLLSMAACAAAPPRPIVVPSPVMAEAPPAPATPAPAAPAATMSPSKAEFSARMAEVSVAWRKHDLARAAEILAELHEAVATQHPRLESVVFYQASLRVYAGDLMGAWTLLTEHLAHGGVPAGSWAFFGYHNALIMVRTALADLSGALVECALMVEAGQHPPFTDDADGRNLVLLKKAWHEAYLLRMAAAAVPAGWFHDGAYAASLAAREEYRRLATPLGDYGDSIAVLDAFFAVHDGDAQAALAAARLVDIGKDDDVEDLYLVHIGLEAGGDAAGAARVRERIAELNDVSLAAPIMEMWLARDLQAAAGGRVLWSPRHPRGAQP